MQPISPHTHNDVDSPKLFANDAIVGAPANALTSASVSSAGATYTATEQGLINNTKTRLNELVARLQALGLIK